MAVRAAVCGRPAVRQCEVVWQCAAVCGSVEVRHINIKYITTIINTMHFFQCQYCVVCAHRINIILSSIAIVSIINHNNKALVGYYSSQIKSILTHTGCVSQLGARILTLRNFVIADKARIYSHSSTPAPSSARS